MPRLLLFLVTSTVLLADTPTAAVVGVVTDQNGGALATAAVQAKNLDTGITTTTATNGAGAYRLPALTPGTYEIIASSPQFKTMKRTAVHLDVGQEARLDFTLTVGDVSETVVVAATSTAVDTETPAQSSIVNQQAVENLPLNGRQLQNLALTTPGVAAGWNWSDAANRYGKARENLEGAFVVNGTRGRSNDFILDGMPMNLRQYGVINFEPSVEAVEEFRLIASVPPAEFGRTMGSTVNIVTRSGGDRFHGALYEFLRNDKLDANDTFSNRAGLDRGKLRQNQFGGSLGGPIYGHRHFFFLNTELLRNIAGVETRLTSVPTADERAGRIRYTGADGTSKVLDLSSSITPLSKRLLEFYPQPNASGPGGLNYNASLTIALNDYQYHARTDHYFGQKDIVSIRTSWNLNDQVYIVNRFGGPYIPGFSLPNPERTTNGTLGYSHTFGPAMINEARIGVNRYSNPLANGDTASADSIGLPNGASANGIPFIQFNSGPLENLGGQPWFNRDQNELTVVGSDAFSYLHGGHSLKFGAEISRLHYNTRGAYNQRGTVYFDGSQNGLIPSLPGNERARVLADFLLGLPYQASITVGQFGRGYRQWAGAFYAQDSWRATRKLTLNLGLRYEYSAPWTEVNHKLSNFLPGRGLLVEGQPGWDGLYAPDRNNFGPRAGFAYDANGSGTTIVRGGFAMLYETLLQANSVQLIENNPPFSAAAFTRSPTPFSKTTAPSTTLLDLRALAQPSNSLGAIGSFRNPYTMQFAFSVQHLFGQHWLGEIAYVATRGIKLPMYRNINQVPIEQSVNAPRPYPAYDTITQSANIASSIYHSGQLKLQRRFGSGLNLITSYTYSKSIDDASDFDSSDPSETVLDSYDLSRQRGPSSFDITHRFTASFDYPLPVVRSWTVNGIATLQSGQPFTPYVSTFDPYRSESFNRPDVTGDPGSNVLSGYAFSPAAFRAPAAGTFGNAGRNIVRGGGFQSFDLSVFKTFTIAERVHLQVRAESVNALNRVNYQGPVTNLGSTPGVFVAAAPPRILQLGAKFSF